MAIPLTLYKYIPRQFAPAMMDRGSIQIGTFRYYQKHPDMEIGDPNETKKTVTTSFPEGRTIRSAQEWTEKLGHLKDTNISYVQGTVEFEPGASLVGNYDVLDAYMYCVSTKYDDALFPDAACIQINNPIEFCREILRTMVTSGYVYDFCFSDYCKYDGHDVGPDNPTSAHFLKDSKYSHQDEYRFVFQPLIRVDGKIVEPMMEAGGVTFPKVEMAIDVIIIESPAISKYCSWKRA